MSTTATRTPSRSGSPAVPARRRLILDHSGNPAEPPASFAPKPERAKPIDEVRLGRAKAAIWQNVVETEGGTSVR